MGFNNYHWNSHIVQKPCVNVGVSALPNNKQSFIPIQGIKFNFFPGSHLAPKYFKVVANSKKLVVIMTHTQTIFTLLLY